MSETSERTPDSDGDPLFSFHPEQPPAPTTTAPTRPWRVLSVDDDAAFQRSLAHALDGVRILDRDIELIQAESMHAAARRLARDRDFAVILVDVVMETDDAGLRLAKGVREMLGLQEPRIVLLTGQPGFAPIDDVMTTYDLSDYCLKSDLASRGLKNLLTAAVRAYDQLTTVSAARRGLQLILEASNRFSAARTVHELAGAALAELAELLGVHEEGIVAVCSSAEQRETPSPEASIVAAAGRFATHVHRPVAALDDAGIANAIMDALRARHNISTRDYQVLYFPHQHAMDDYAVFVATGRPLEHAEQELVSVFAANASKGFGNLALISQLDRMAYEDELLAIPNRSALLREIDRLRLKRDQLDQFQLVLVDLDNFSGFNDAFGTDRGNAVLHALVPVLREAFPPPAYLARLYSDLFAVLGPREQVTADRAHTAMERPLKVGNQHYRFSACSAQIRLHEAAGSAADLLRAVRATLRQAKNHGPGSSAHFDPQSERQAGERFELMSRLVTAIDGRELFLMFQPQVDLQTGRIVGAEGLLRWRTAEGFIPPGNFIPLAEESSYIHAIGQIVAERAVEALHRFQEAGLYELVLSINMSARQFEDRSAISDKCTIEALLATLTEAQLPTHRLCVEVTETTAMTNFAQVSRALETFRAAGGFVAIDDFGTGLASLEYVHRLPADHIKIDRVFVSRLGDDARSGEILRIIMALGEAIDAQLVAEGVETEAQADWLRREGCHMAQGWHFGRPMALEDFISHCQRQGTGA